MNIYSYHRGGLKLSKILFCFVPIFLILSSGCIADTRKGITLEEAQDLVEFSICLPDYIPADVDPDPYIIYSSELTDPPIPQETDIILQYFTSEEHKLVFEIVEEYAGEITLQTENSPEANDSAKITLLYWVTESPDQLLGKEFDNAVERTTLKASLIPEESGFWWLYNITEPIEYRSTMSEWIFDGGHYYIVSYYQEDEITRITRSMLDCNYQQ